MSCRRFTVQVNTDDDGIIVFAAPIVKKFLGQPIENLRRWMQGLDAPGLVYEEVTLDSNEQDPIEDVQPEYNFKGGVRGKYVHRLKSPDKI